MTNKQKVAIKTAENNISIDTSKLSDIHLKVYWLMPLGINGIKQKEGISPEKAFFDWSERGVKPTETSDVRRLVKLMMGHKKIALNKSLQFGGGIDE